MKRRIVIIFILTAVCSVSAFAGTVSLNISVSNPYLLADTRQTVFLKVGLLGAELENSLERTPANVAIVLDRSGSMDGEKIIQAREAAMIAVGMLDERDIVSIVTYSDTVSVLVPATRVTKKSYLYRKIESIFAAGSTALFAGVSKGADEVSKFFERSKVNRVILLSDGLANVGPDSPMALGNLGESLKRTGISVTTIGLGLGYNEDLMVMLAQRSDGNHAFVENYNDLTRIFQYEFSDILSVVAQDVKIQVTCPAGVVPLRMLGREAEIIGNKVYTSISQIYSSQEKYLLLELDIPGGREGTQADIARIDIEYGDMQSRRIDSLSSVMQVSYTRSKDTVEGSKDKETLVEAAKQIATERTEEAIRLRDQGEVEKAQRLLEENADYLDKEAKALESEELEDLGGTNRADAAAVEDDADWGANRKRMKADSYETQTQQSY